MSVNHLFGNKKRNSSLLYGVDQAKVTASCSSFQGATSQSNIGNHGDGFPPNKRYKSVAAIECKRVEDPFEDGDDFTEDDLIEIDTLASQALTQDASLKVDVVKSEWNAGLSSPLTNTIQTTNHISQWNVAHNTGQTSTVAFGSSIEENIAKDNFRLETLQIQHVEAKKKLREMQDEMLIKNGEIKILRDSMQQMESTMEEQRKSYVLLEKEKAQCLSEKEKEFSRKLQSLQSELHFRDAEMNELRMKLLNYERIKTVTPSVSSTSPKKSSLSLVKVEDCTQNERKSYPTKESFGSEILQNPSCFKTQLVAQAPLINKDNTKPGFDSVVKQEMSYVRAQTQGSVLINALMKQPVVMGSALGFTNLLNSGAAAWPGPVLQRRPFNRGSTRIFSDRSTSSNEKEASLRVAQRLAVTGLNLISMDEGSSEERAEENKSRISHLQRYKIPGAVYILPLLEHHIGAYYQTLQLIMKSGSPPSGNQSTCSSRTSSSTNASVDDTLFVLEEFALTSLGVLYDLILYSWDVVSVLLSCNVKPGGGLGDTETDTAVCSKQCKSNIQEPNPELDVADADQSQHSLFKILLQLMALCTTAAEHQRRNNIMNQCLKVAVKLAEKSTVDLLTSFQHLFDSPMQTLLRCVSPEAPLSAVHQTVRLLTLLAENQTLASQFCSCSETCLLLALYMYITLRPDKSACDLLWLQLEQETVRFLTKCVQCCSQSVLLVGTVCQCNPEVVKALVIMLHRQWLTVRRVEGNLVDAHERRVVQLLRDTVLLLHNLSQKDKRFHSHCMDVLHQFDHVMPGVRAILRKNPNLKACEELALDELYPLETDVSDQEMDSS